MSEIKRTGKVLTFSPDVLNLNPAVFHQDGRVKPAAGVPIPGVAPKYLEPSATIGKKRLRQNSKPLLNKLEERFSLYLDRSISPGNRISKQAIRFRLANGLWYKPDFVCLSLQVAWEVKGPHAFRGGFENLKMAAAAYPEFEWFLAWEEGGAHNWQLQKVLS